MTLALDTRQRAMLAEMGVRVWMPQPPAHMEDASVPVATVHEAAPANPSAAAHAVPAAPHAPAAPAAASGHVRHTPAARQEGAFVQAGRPAPVAASFTTPVVASSVAPVAPVALQPLPDLAACDWAALQVAAGQCQACSLCAGRAHGVWDAAGTALAAAAPAPDQPRWLFVTDPPGAAENASGAALQGDPGVLLANMVAAVRLQPAQVYRSHATKCAPPGGRNAQLDELQTCAAYLQREIVLVQPQVIVALGRNAAYSLLQRTEPLGQLRGQPHALTLQGRTIPVIVSYPLGYLLRNPAAKAQAWIDLGRALVAASPAH